MRDRGVGRSAMLPWELEPARVSRFGRNLGIGMAHRRHVPRQSSLGRKNVECERVVWGRDLLSLGASANFASPDRQQPFPCGEGTSAKCTGYLASLSKARNPRGEGFRFRAGPRTFPIPSRSRKPPPTFGEYLRRAAACQIHHFDNVNVTCVLCRSMG